MSVYSTIVAANTVSQPKNLVAVLVLSAGFSLSACSSDSNSGGDVPPSGALSDQGSTTPDETSSMLNASSAISCATESLAFAIGRFGRDYQDSMANFYNGGILGTVQAFGEPEPDTGPSPDFSILNYMCPNEGDLEVTTIFGDPSIQDDSFSREFQTQGCGFNGSTVTGSWSFREGLGSDVSGGTMDTPIELTDSYEVTFIGPEITERVSATVTSRVRGSNGSPESGNDAADSLDQVYANASYAYSRQGLDFVEISSATGAFTRQLDSESVQVSQQLDGCFTVNEDPVSRLPVSASVSTPVMLSLTPDSTNVSAGILRFEASDGSIAEVSATSDPAMARIDITDTARNTDSVTVPWSTMIFPVEVDR